LRVFELQQQLLNIPWIKQVDVRKVWPNNLIIHFEEHIPAAFWHEKGGKKGILSKEGIVFYPDMKDVKKLVLPKLEGPQERSSLVWQQLAQMDALLKPLNLQVSELSLVARGAWQLRLSNGLTVVLGRHDELKRLAQFVRYYQQNLQEKALQIASVDMRYTSGMAIAWKDPKENV
jgi:cell division protein FtsQ